MLFTTLLVVTLGGLSLFALGVWFVFPQLLVNWKQTTAIIHQPQTNSLLSKEECEKVFADVLSMRDIWKVFPNPFGVKALYYLGAAKYIEQYRNYEEHYAQMNPVLRDRFEWLYKRVIDFYQERLREPVRLIDRGAYPGFHIFVGSKWAAFPIGSLHFDVRATQIGAPNAEGKTVTGYFSFTLPIQLPKKGAGLYLFDETSAEVAPSCKPLLRFRNKIKLHYQEGMLVTHEGTRYHMIAPSEIDPEEYRITLQGHGVAFDGVWHLFF